MTKLDTAPYKGVQDFYPEDMAIENHIFDTWRKVAKSFGYVEYNASPLEPTELYSEKSGEEIVNQQTFTFIDRGGRSVTLRPEMTPTLARMVAARRRSLKFPLRWFSIPNLFRYEKPQRGRRREHYQLNCDLLGIADKSADLEIIKLAYLAMKEFGASDESFEIRLNFPTGSMEELKGFQETLAEAGIKNTKIDETLARGQAYYTGIVFEFFDTNPDNPRSICGGGRYDSLLELFDVEPVPAVGFGWGDITTRDFLETHGLLGRASHNPL
jgi:histidyl-tRNA synthetase